MLHPDVLERVCLALEALWRERLDVIPDADGLRMAVHESLLGERGIWKPFSMGLVSKREVARFVADRLHSWLVHSVPGATWESISTREGELYVDACERSIFDGSATRAVP